MWFDDIFAIWCDVMWCDVMWCDVMMDLIVAVLRSIQSLFRLVPHFDAGVVGKHQAVEASLGAEHRKRMELVREGA